MQGEGLDYTFAKFIDEMIKNSISTVKQIVDVLNVNEVVYHNFILST